MSGTIDEVQLFVGEALSDAEILAIHAAGPDGVCFSTSCGDGATQPGEGCDDGNLVAGDGCENDCSLSCGDGVITGSEVCDDSDLEDGDGCDSNCKPTACGNGAVSTVTGETCDDGNLVDADGCDSNCTWTACGNGVTTPTRGELCDDGNLVSGDGCTNSCEYTPVFEVLPPGGGTVSTDTGSGATPAFPTQVSLTTTNGGLVTIDSVRNTVSVDGVVAIGVTFEISTATAADANDPIVITMTIDASVIPSGADLSQIQGIRNHVPLLDCSGPLVADPDPCLAGLAALPGGDLELTMLTTQGSVWQVGVRAQTKDEQKCTAGVCGAGLKVAKAQAKEGSSCLSAAAKGSEPDAQACLTADTDGKVAGAYDKTVAKQSAKCAAMPPFGLADTAVVNGAARDAALGVVSDLFGSHLETAVLPASDAAGSQCQAAILKTTQKLFDTRAKLLLTCVKGALAGKPTLAVGSGGLRDCFARVDADPKGKIAKSVTKIADALTDSCVGVSVPTALAGTCSAAGNVPACLSTRISCGVCRMFDAANELDADCDIVDDGIDDASCP